MGINSAFKGLILDTRTHLENKEVDGRIILKGN
jgi:hypothetical protein